MAYCQKMIASRLTTGTGGNMAFVQGQGSGHDPTGIDYFLESC